MLGCVISNDTFVIMCDDNLVFDVSARPQTPHEDDCCGNACNPCIFDVHRKLLEQWEVNNKKRIAGKVKRKNLLQPTQYKLFRVIDIERDNDDYVIINLEYIRQSDEEGEIFLNPGQHVIINLSTWSKPFTPISWTEFTIKLLVRVYRNGVNTNKLKNLNKGEEIKIRGPYGDFLYTRNRFTKILMFGMGSGIAALYPIVKSIVDDELDETRVDLIVGFRTVDGIPLKRELRLLTDFWNVSCTLYISKGDETRSINGLDVLDGRINESVVRDILGKESRHKTLILICGTVQFNQSILIHVKNCNFINYHVFE